jgi:hypothetical protein
MMMMMILSPFGRLGLWAPSSRVRDDDDDDDDDNDDDDDDDDNDNRPVWPTWAVSALFRGAVCTHINHVWFHIPLS